MISSWWQKLVILALLFAGVHINHTVGIQSQKFTYNVGGQGCLQAVDFLVNPGQIFGCCKHGRYFPAKMVKSGVPCTFAMETSKTIDSPDHLRVCNFTIRSDNVIENEVLDSYLSRITAIDRDTAVLTIIHLYYVRLFFLNFDDCRSVEVYLPESYLSYVLLSAANGDKFHAVTDRWGKGYSRMLIDTAGNIIEKHHLWISHNSDPKNGVKAALYNPDGGHLVVDTDKIINSNNKSNYAGIHLTRIYIADNNGTIEMLKEYPVEELNVNNYYGVVLISTTYNFLSVCSKLSMNYTCAQFDLVGSLKFETNFSMNEENRIRHVVVHNLPQGGFLFFIRSDGPYLVVKQIDATGKLVAILNLDVGSSLSFLYTMHVFANEENGICLSYSSLKNKSKDMSLYTMCLQEDDFSANVVAWPIH